MVRCWFAAVIAISGLSSAGLAQDRQTFAAYIRAESRAVLDRLSADGDYTSARRDAQAVFRQAIAYAGPRDLELLREPAFAARLVAHLQACPPGMRQDLLKYLLANDDLARALVFLVGRDEPPAPVYAVLDRLQRDRGKALNAFAGLAAALCVVHDRPLERRINENKAAADDVVALFDFYSANESRMLFGIRNVPPELLIYVVDSTAGVDEMQWALGNYAGHRAVGKLFFDIKYDHEHVRTDRPKRVTEAGFSLPNILKYGGVCADQAYFATQVGKAIGVPTAYTSGISGETAHAWVGFLDASAARGRWNFDTGRYETYRGLRGIVLDPQTRDRIPDAFVSLTAELIGTSAAQRHAACALADAARLMSTLDGAIDAPPPPAGLAGALAKPRDASIASRLTFLESAVRLSPGSRNGWDVIQELALAGELNLAQKKQWSNVLISFCGDKYPDFALAVLKPMIQSVDDVREQDLLWMRIFAMFSASRADLAAEVRMAQAAMWEKNGDPTKAGLCYFDIIERFPNAGPFVVDALEQAEKALVRTNRADRVIPLYEQTFSRIRTPREMSGPLIAQTNWYVVGMMLADRLEKAGLPDRAAPLRSLLRGRAGATTR